MEKPIVNRKQGEYAINLNDQWFILKANFGNIALFEENVTGIYVFADNISNGNIKMTDIVNLLFCFNKDRETNGLTQDDYAQMVISAPPNESIEAVAGFMSVLFGVDDMEKTEEVSDTEKK